MGKLLWEPSEEQIKNANMTKFINYVNDRYEQNFDSYFELYDWSINKIPDFWAAMWDFGKIKASKPYEMVVDDLGKFPGAKWFVGAKLNFAENLLRHRDDHTAFVFKGENQKEARMSYAELYDIVVRLAKSLREIGIEPGDRVVGYMPNMIETAVAMLNPEIPVPKRNKAPRMTRSCGSDGKRNIRNVVKSKGDMYTIPRNPPASNLPIASSIRVIGRLSM